MPPVLSVTRPLKHYKRSIEQVVALSGILPQTTIATLLGETRAFVRYWAKKAADSTFHNALVGGARHVLFPDDEQLLVEEMLFCEVKRNPSLPSRAYASILTGRGFGVDARWVSRTLNRMGFTSKRVKYRNIAKFSLANAIYTAQYITGVLAICWYRLKFVDESRFDSRLGIARGWAARGRPVEVVRNVDSVRSWSVTCITNLRNPRGFVLSQPISGTNGGLDFLETLINWLDSGVLQRGDVLVMDNCGIHKSEDIAGLRDLLLAAAGVLLYFLPTYSPEYNPCEQIFARAKRYLREERGDGDFLAEVLEGFGCVSWFDIVSYYEECIEKPFRE